MPRRVEWSREFDKSYQKHRRKNQSIENKVGPFLEKLEAGENPGSSYVSSPGSRIRKWGFRANSLDLRILYHVDQDRVRLLLLEKRKDFRQRTIDKAEQVLRSMQDGD